MTSLVITSPSPGEGKTAVAAALMRTMRLAGYRREGSDGRDAAFIQQSVGSAAGDAVVERDGAASGAIAVVAYRGEGTVAAAPRDVLGVILNGVPLSQLAFAQHEVAPFMNAPVLGLIPESRLLRSATVAELADFLDGEVLTAQDAVENVVESYMVGAMSHVSGIPYFSRKQNKAVVTGGDRIDVHMAALGTPCQCIVATGGFDPDPIVLERAEAQGVPMVKVYPDAVTTLDRISQFLKQVRFRHAYKVEPFVELFQRHVDLTPIARALGAAAHA